MPTIYHYAENGEYSGQSEALESPLEPGVFLIPRNATESAPPEVIDGYARVYDGQTWGHVLDKRGLTYWLSHSESRAISQIGEDVPNGAFLERPYDEVIKSDLLEVTPPTKQQLLEQIAILTKQINDLKE